MKNLGDTNDIFVLVNESNRRLELDPNKVYYLNKIVDLPNGFTLEGNGALIRVKPQRNEVYPAFLLKGDNITVQNINVESESIYEMIGHADKVDRNPNTSNIYAFVSKEAHTNFTLKNSTFKSVSSILKLSNVKGLILENIKGTDCQNAIYCQYCSDVTFNGLDIDRSSATNRFTHHLYFNSVNNLKVSNSKFSGGAGKAINIKVDDATYPSSRVRISDVRLDTTGGIFLTTVDDVVVDRLKSYGTKQLLILAGNVGDVTFSNSEIYTLDDYGPTISAIDNKSAVKNLSVTNTQFMGAINIEGHSIENFVIDSCTFTDFFYDKLVRGQNVFYMKEGRYQGKFSILNSRFFQTKQQRKNTFIRNETNINFRFENNIVDFKFPQNNLILTEKKSVSYLSNNKISGVSSISNDKSVIRGNE